MNKVILMGRLTKDPEITYSKSSNPVAIAKFTLAVPRRFKRDGEPDADFIMCTAFGKTADTIEKYVKKGAMISVCGHLQVRSWTDQNTNQTRWATDVLIEEFYFTGKGDGGAQNTQSSKNTVTKETMKAVVETISDDEDLPF